jgi:hypothetical protein
MQKKVNQQIKYYFSERLERHALCPDSLLKTLLRSVYSKLDIHSKTELDTKEL